MTQRKAQPYAPGELEVILSLIPTDENIGRLAALLGRTEDAISIVYRIAYERGKFARSADVQRRKIFEAKRTVGICIGGGQPRRPRPTRGQRDDLAR